MQKELLALEAHASSAEERKELPAAAVPRPFGRRSAVVAAVVAASSGRRGRRVYASPIKRTACA